MPTQNPKKIAFITCVSNEREYAESCYYLNRLHVPEGYETDVIAIREAPSMCAGYNAGMESSDAKYKIYLHQDTFLIYPDILMDMLHIFEDKSIGMIGCIGRHQMDEYARAVTGWDVGYIINHPRDLYYPTDGEVDDVQAIDGLFMATQVDLPWREDLFDGFHFYDTSQCMEMLRAGKRIVVPRQEKVWCFHDNSFSKMRNYYDTCNLFVEEYQDIFPFVKSDISDRFKEYENLKANSRDAIIAWINQGGREGLSEMFQDEELRGMLHMRELYLLADIDEKERQQGISENGLWEIGLPAKELFWKIYHLEHLCRRIQFHAGVEDEIREELKESYSAVAVEVMKEYICL